MNLGNVLIMGDSYSTFEGYIPEGYGPYYTKNPEKETDVRDVAQTWWYQVLSETGAHLVQNNSWSGSTIGFTTYGGRDCSRQYSFIYRWEQLEQNRFFKDNQIDTVFIFGATNDSWADAPLGKLMLEGWKRKDLYQVLPAIGYYMHQVRQTLPESRIYGIVNDELKTEIKEGLQTACAKNDIAVISLKEIDKVDGHPTALGMRQIKNQIMTAL